MKCGILIQVSSKANLEIESSSLDINGVAWESFEIENDFEDEIVLKNFTFSILKEFLYIYGGYNFDNKVTKSFFRINFVELVFEEIEFKGQEPSPRSFAVS